MKETAISENHLYSKAYRKGKKYETPTVVVYLLPDRHASFIAKSHPQKKKINRLGITVRRKLGSAVERNRVKRVIRHGYREVVREKEMRVGNLIVIVARSAALKAKSTDIARDLRAAFSVLGLTK